MRAAVLMLALFAACRMGFDPIDTEQTVGTIDAAGSSSTGDGAVTTGDAGPLIPCQMRIANTDNAYLPIAQCLSELDVARTECNADPACVLTGWYWGPMTGINDTGACADGGGNTGCRQWLCSTRGALYPDHLPI